MAGDYSRKRFNPEKHYQGVLRQQGRVDLDADWNEYVDLQDRRWRAETIDVVGRCGVPSETPNGFKIQGALPDLTIGQGRIYVDGLLAENHGSDRGFNATLEENYGNAPVSIKDQPYGAKDLKVPAAGRSLIYLEVWRREVTYLQEAGLIEPAVNVDTTTRAQTAWQVKVLESLDPAVTCQTAIDEIPGWPSGNLPTTARLSTKTVAVTEDPDPCLVPPTGGYRGLENHLYRVEVHEVTSSGSVLVKWSRENAHVAANVLEIRDSGQSVRVESFGRDDVLRFKDGDWVEITSDAREFAGIGGNMRKVTVNETDLTLSFTGPLDSDLKVEDHLRVVRWDQFGSGLTSNGLIELGAANPSAILEHGIEITMSGFAGAHAGDYWCFAARTADADIERLEEAPPLGVHRHFCKLAIIEADGTIQDCRTVFPPLTELNPGCCSVVVRPGENIQAAIDSLPEQGGCVCLQAGLHEISEPLRIEKSNVSLHGESRGAEVVRTNGAALLVIGHPDGLLLSNIAVTGIQFHFANEGASQPGLGALLSIDRCHNSRVENCTIRAQKLQSLVGVMIGRSSDIEVINNNITGVTFGCWVASDTTLLQVRGNTFTAITANNNDGGIVGIFLMDVFGPCDVKENNLSGFIFGIALNHGLLTGTPSSLATGSVISDNRILRMNTQAEGSEIKAFGIDAAAAECTIRNNHLIYAAAAYGGIAASGHDPRIEGNIVRSLAKEASESPSIGILVARVGPEGSFGSVGGIIARNRILGAQDGCLLIGNTGAEVVDNCVESDAAQGRLAVGLLASSRVRAQGNSITNALFPLSASAGSANEITDNTVLRGGGGVTLLNQSALSFAQNRIEDMRDYGLIALQGSAKFAVVENRFLACGYQQRLAIGIGLWQHSGELHIASCEVMNTGVSPDNATVSQIAFGMIAGDVLEARVQSNTVTYTNPALLNVNQEHRALWLRGFLEQVVNVGGAQLVIGFSAQILDNKFLGPGRSALVEVAEQGVTDNLFRRFERLFFNNNFCWHTSVPGQTTATVSLAARSAIVMGNHIKTTVPIASVDFHSMKEAIYMGNIAQSGPINFGGLPSPLSGFNRP